MGQVAHWRVSNGKTAFRHSEPAATRVLLSSPPFLWWRNNLPCRPWRTRMRRRKSPASAWPAGSVHFVSCVFVVYLDEDNPIKVAFTAFQETSDSERALARILVRQRNPLVLKMASASYVKFQIFLLSAVFFLSNAGGWPGVCEVMVCKFPLPRRGGHGLLDDFRLISI